MKYISLILLAVLLTACATTQPVIQVKTVTVDVPVAVPCKAVVPTAPLYNFSKSKTTDDVFDKTKSLLADRDLSLGYEAELLAALNSCVK
jgi:hypothetical protein